MKRLHIHIKVKELDQSAKFYAALFGREPDKREADYAKWLLEEPAANISISARAGEAAIDHVGIQLEDDGALATIAARLEEANADITREADATCCYARSNKYWAVAPEGAVWELFHTFGDATTYGTSRPLAKAETPCGCAA